MELLYADDDKLFVPVERLDLVQKYTGAVAPSLDLGGTAWENTKTRVKKAMRDMADELLKLYAARKTMPGHAFVKTRPGSRSSRTRSSTTDRDQATAITRSSGTWNRRADGPAALRRRRIRQNRSGDARRVQGGDGRQAGGHSGPDDGSGVPAPETLKNASRPFRSASNADPVPAKAEQKRSSRIWPPARSTSSSARTACCRRTWSSKISGCGRRRGAAVRRRAQGEHQADEQAGRRADDDGHADSADAEHVAGGHSRHVGHRDAAEGSAVDPDERREVRQAVIRAPSGSRSSAAARCTSSTTASSPSTRSPT